MNVAIYGRKINRNDVSFFIKVIDILTKFNWNIILEEDLKKQIVSKIGILKNAKTFSTFRDFDSGIDLAISIGGDGTFIKTISYIRSSGVPILGINTGRLGFLANISPDFIEEALMMAKEKKYIFQNRSLLKIETENNLFGENNFAVNEVTLHKKDTASMITVHVSLDDNYLNSYWADGLIVATPTGSTAYSLSCGGPIVTPGCQIHLLTPIAPHNLNVRPMVVPDHLPIKLSIEGRERKYLISLDSISKSIPQKSDVFVYKANFLINVIRFENNTFLDTIRNKMLWGIDKRNY
jgi:NAD+ kinase